jgi:hypothetical protein
MITNYFQRFGEKIPNLEDADTLYNKPIPDGPGMGCTGSKKISHAFYNVAEQATNASAEYIY